MKKVLFIVFPAIGHLHASFRMARVLKENGYVVLYAGPDLHKRYINTQGFQYHSLTSHPFAAGFEKRVYKKELKSKQPYLDELLARLTNRFYHDRKKELNELVDQFKPTHIILDSFISTDFIVVQSRLAAHNIKIFFMQTMLSTYQRTMSPPPTYGEVPDRNWKVAGAWMMYYLSNTLRSWTDRLLLLGCDDASLINKMFWCNKIPAKHGVLRAKAFQVSFGSITELVLAPEEFEVLPFTKLGFQTYVGSQVDTSRIEHFPADYLEFIKKVALLKEQKKIHLIYCSFGTLYEKRKAMVGGFLLKLIEVVADSDELHLIVSVDEKDLPAKVKPRSNIYISSQLPQLHVLKHCDAFISHGGLNSIKESILFNVPMIVYPLDMAWDQPGNCAKVSYHKLGMVGTLRKATKANIYQRITEVIDNPAYRENVMKMNGVTESKYSAHRFMNEFESL
jgi:UDP:flavonoid glycosyltransferase YjiC (YdhE family)